MTFIDERFTISPHCTVLCDHINVGVISGDAGILLIDFGDGSFTSLLGPDEIAAIDTILLTHHHRDQVCGLNGIAGNRIRLVVPEAERAYFESADEYWNDPVQRWHCYHFHPHRLMLAEPVHVDGIMDDGDTLEWGPARITAVSTPGHTDGSLTYIVDVDGHRVAFTGDLLYDAGKVWDIYSLQKGSGMMDYHGFMGARVEAEASLRRLLDARITEIVPSHGSIMHDPQEAMTATIDALEDVYTRFAAISALRTHFPEYLERYSGSPIAMPMRPGFAAPEYLRHVLTTWVAISDTGAAFVMDCYSDEVIRQLQEWLADGIITSVEGLWVTHYHDDHVEAIPEFQKAFDCELIADRSVADVISNPLAWQLPCLSPKVARVDRRTDDGDTWTWREFTMTAYHFPGQSLHHGGLLVEGHGDRLFFAGDSFAPGGLDDYCAYNRNFLGDGIGYHRCMKLLQELKPTHIFNAHLDQPFSFTDAEYEFMIRSLADRRTVLADLLPWDDPNYGIDNAWAFCLPYEQTAAPGDTVSIHLVVTNHSPSTRTTECRAHIPAAWGSGASETATATIPAGECGRLGMAIHVPPDAPHGRYVIPVDVLHGDIWIPQFAEAIVTVD